VKEHRAVKTGQFRITVDHLSMDDESCDK